MIIRETERLRIERFTKEDASFILELMNTESWHKYIGDRGLKTKNDAIQYLENGHFKSYSENNFGFYKVSKLSSNKAIGTCGLVKRDELKHIDMGFALLPEYEGKGYGFESSLAILDHAKNDIGLENLVAITALDNDSSIKLLLKLGFVYNDQIHFGTEKELLNLYHLSLAK